MLVPSLKDVSRALSGVPAIGEAEAPVVARLHDTMRPMRLHGGRLWRLLDPIIDMPGHESALPFLDRYALDPEQTWGLLVGRMWHGGRLRGHGPQTWFGSNPWLAANPMPGSRAGPQPGLLALLPGSVILVDGILHAACEGPALLVRMVPGLDRRIDHVCPSDVTLTGGMSLFATGRWADAVRLAGDDPVGEPQRNGAVLEATCPMRDDASCLPAEILHDFLASCHGHGVGLVSPRVTDWLADLREAQETDGLPLGDLHGRLQALRDATDGFPAPPPGKDPPADMAGTRARAARRIHGVASFHLRRLEFETFDHSEDLDALASLFPG